MKNETLYGKVAGYIKDGIEKGIFKPEKQIPTEMELVERFSVSRPTVNKALNELSLQGLIYRVPGKGSFVCKNTNKNINKNATRIVSLITPFEEGIPVRSDEIQIIRGVENFLKEKGFFLTLQFTNQDADIEIQLITKSWKEGMDGIILYPTANFDNFVLLNELLEEHYPIVLLDRHLSGLSIATVQSDNKKGGYEAAKHLIDMEYEYIYFVSDYKVNSISSIMDRFLGYLNALRDNKIKFSSEMCIEGFAVGKHNVMSPFAYRDNPDAFRRIISEIMRRSKGKRVGVFAVNDPLAHSLISAAMDVGVNIPDELGVVGFDDTGNHNGLLTSIKQDFYKIGSKSAEMIFNIINDNSSNIEKNIYVDVELVVRKSTGIKTKTKQTG